MRYNELYCHSWRAKIKREPLNKLLSQKVRRKKPMTANSSPSIVVLHNPALHVRRHLLYKKLQSQLPDSAYTYATTGDYEKDLKALKVACKGASSLIAVGGDGTLNLAVNAIANTSTVLGVV